MTIWKRHICGIWMRRWNCETFLEIILGGTKIIFPFRRCVCFSAMYAGGSLETPVLVKTIPAVTVAAMEQRIESYDALFDLMPAMGAVMEKLGCQCALPEYCFTHYLEPGYKEEHVLVEACEAVTEKKEDTETVKFKEMPEIQAACVYHHGSYNDFPRTYSAILKYIEENGYEICGNIREKYIDGVWNKESEKEWLSEIQIPVKYVNQ